jgi:hypothetical protein
LLSTFDKALDLQVQGDTLYFRTRNAVWSLPTDGASVPTRLYDSAYEGLQVDETSLYFFGSKNADSTYDLMKAPLGGGAPVVLAPAVGPGLVAINDTLAVIATDANTIVTVPLSGGMSSVVATLPPGAHPASFAIDATPGAHPASFAIDATTSYWTVASPMVHSCAAMPLVGGPLVQWFCDGNGKVAVDGANVYAVLQYEGQCYQDQVCGGVSKSTVGGTDAMNIVQIKNEYTTGVTIDDHHLYWNTGTRIFRGNLDGGDATEIAEQQAPDVDDYILDMTIDDSYVFWSSTYRTAIWRSPK